MQIESLIRTGIEPRISVHVKEIVGYGDDGNGFVILIHIPQSFASPHMVTFKNSSRFYCRHSAGKYQLDVQEIGSAFLATDSQADRIRSFLQDRLAKIIADETPIELSMPHRMVLHILPLNSFLNQKRFNFDVDHNLQSNFHPIAISSYDHRYNLDGFLTYRASKETSRCSGYCQIFFDGTIEAVCANILYPHSQRQQSVINGISYERNVVEAVRNYFKGYKMLGVEAPVIISMALLGCKGAYLDTDFTEEPIDRDVAILPEAQTDSLDEEVPTIMKPIFDAVWNACGHPYSGNYTQNGTWNVRL